MDRQKVINKFNELPVKRRMVLEKFLHGHSRAKIMCDLTIGDSALEQHLRQLYKDFCITDETERKQSALIRLFANAMPELISGGTIGVPPDRGGGAEESNLPERTTKTSFYVERPPTEQRCYDLIRQPGSLLRIEAPGKMGKTSLMQNIFQRVEERCNYRTVRVDLRSGVGDEGVISTLDKFLRWLCNNVNSQLQPTTQVDYEWTENLSSLDNCKNYFEKRLLSQIDHNSALVLGLDNVERVYPHSTIAVALLNMLRTLYEEARTNKILSKLRVVMAYTHAYDLIKVYESPFNVGTKIDLPLFKETQVIELAEQHNLTLSEIDIKALLKLVGGYPLLLNKAFENLKYYKQTTLDQLLEQAPTYSGIYSEELLNLLKKLEQHPELATAMKKVVDAETDSVSMQLKPEQVSQLKCMGLVHVVGNNVKPSCELYRLYFREHLYGASNE